MKGKSTFWGIVWFGLSVSQAAGYTLLGFPSDTSVQQGVYTRWALDQASPPVLDLSHAVQSDLLGGLAGAQSAVLAALTSWDQANTTMKFTAAGYQPVVNSRSNWIAGGYYYEGPGKAAGGVGIGANIDIMSRPAGFSFTDVYNHVVTIPSNSLAVTAPIVASQTLLSVDIYLNSSFSWSTTGGNFDVQTVVLHELGHALGLDHPNQAASHGAANYDPFTHQPGKAWSTTDVMYSDYTGINRSLTSDEIGGLAFLCPVTGDANTSGRFTFADVQLAIDMYFGYAPAPNRVALRNIDLNKNGVLNFSDLNGLITMYFYPDQPAPPGFSLTLLEDMGYDVSNLPEPQTALLLLIGLAAWRRRTGAV